MRDRLCVAKRAIPARHACRGFSRNQMSLQTIKDALELALEALEQRCGTNAQEREPGGVIEKLKQAIDATCPSAPSAASGGKWLTVVYKDVASGEEARALGEHPKASALSWSHALWDRDALKQSLENRGSQELHQEAPTPAPAPASGNTTEGSTAPLKAPRHLSYTTFATVVKALYASKQEGHAYLDSLPSEFSTLLTNNNYSEAYFAQIPVLARALFEDIWDDVDWFLSEWRPGFTVTTHVGTPQEIEYKIQSVDDYLAYALIELFDNKAD